MVNHIVDSYKITKNELPLILLCASLFIFLFVVFIAEYLDYKEHSLYTTNSLWFSLLASFIILVLSFEKSLLIKISCFLLSAFYTQRIITTYLYPKQFEYDSYVNFSYEQIEFSTLYYMGVTVAIFSGLITYRFVFRKQYIYSLNKPSRNFLSNNKDRISYFGFKK